MTMAMQMSKWWRGHNESFILIRTHKRAGFFELAVRGVLAPVITLPARKGAAMTPFYRFTITLATSRRSLFSRHKIDIILASKHIEKLTTTRRRTQRAMNYE